MEKAAPLLCSMKQTKSYWFGKKSELVNDDIIFIFGLIISFKCRNINNLFRCFDVSFTNDDFCEYLHDILSVVLPKGS